MLTPRVRLLLIRRLITVGPIVTPLRHTITRKYSTNGTKLLEDEALKDNGAKNEKGPATSNSPVDTKPWYLSMVDRDISQNLSAVENEYINLPDESPESLLKITKYLKGEMGLKDILIFDLKEKKSGDYNTAVTKISDFVIIATARSAKHCQSTFVQLNAMLKQTFKSVAYVEGNVNSKEERKKFKRMARKSNLGKSWGANSGTTSTGFAKDSEAWFMIDCNVDKIFVNILTERRRGELNLEELYAPESERDKYQLRQKSTATQPKDDNLLQVGEENNVLSGLRRLAYQRRQYSTSSPINTEPTKEHFKDFLKKALNEKNFEEAHSIIKQSQELESLSLLQTITDSLANVNVTTDAINEIDKWQDIFEYCWPLPLPMETSFQYWSLRMKFLKMLNVANPQLYPCSKIIDDYLIRKKTSGFYLSSDDLLQYLQLVKINLNLIQGGNYWDLLKSNENIVKALKVFNELNLANDHIIVSMLLKLMVMENNTSIKLHSLYEVIDFLCCQRDNLSSNVIVAVLETLASVKDWNKFFQFWEVGIKGVVPGQDYRPWSKFIRIILNSNDIELMQKLIEEGHLLWIKRNEVEITNDLIEQLRKLFRRSDYDLKSYLDI